MPTKSERRQRRLMPGGIPRWIRCYDNGGGLLTFCRKCLTFSDDPACASCGGKTLPTPQNEGSFDRYTVVYTGHYPGRGRGRCEYVGMSCCPAHPQGFGQHGEHDQIIDVPPSGFPPTIGDAGHLGRRITFDKLPPECKELVLRDYREIWGLGTNNKLKEEK